MTGAAGAVARRVNGIPVARRLGLDAVELLALISFAGLSLAILVPLLLQGRPLSGSDGFLPADQLQYFAWIREASEHGLVGNRFDLAPGPRSFLHPGFTVSGAVHRVTGLSIPVSYLLWKPVAVVLLFVGFLRYVRRMLRGARERHVALVLALFAVMPASALVAWSGWGGKPRQYTFEFISGEMWTGQFLWGYLMTGIAVGLMPLILLAIERHRSGGSRRVLYLATAGTLLVAWLQPWQGATIAVIVVAVEAWGWLRERHRPAWSLAAVVAAVALPGAYYAALGHFDDSWKLAAEANAAGAQPEWGWPWWAMALTLAPLAVPAALAYGTPAVSWQDRALRVWPIAALVVYLLPGVTFPYHALQGVALPLSILAVQGVRPFGLRPALVVAGAALLILPGTVHKLEVAADNINAGRDPYYIPAGDHEALTAMEHDPRRGGILTTFYGGNFVPYTTGRETYVGALSWSPDYGVRRTRADELFSGRLRGRAARTFVRSTHARFVYAHCGLATDLTHTLGALVEERRDFGCAHVYVLRERPDTEAAAGLPDS